VTLDAGGNASVTLPEGLTSVDQVSLVGLRFLRQKVPYAAFQTAGFSLVNGDADGSNTVSLTDLAMVLADFRTAETTTADLDGSGVVGFGDLATVLVSFAERGD
jgi:hypothetical protein